jgi:hypothetical protein
MAEEYKKAKFKFLKDYKDVAKKGDVKVGRWKKDWKNVELFTFNQLGVVTRKFYVPMDELGKTMNKIEDVTPKPETKPTGGGTKPKPDTTGNTTDENVEDDTNGGGKGKLAQMFTKKNIIIGSIIFVALVVGYNVMKKGKGKRK